MKNLIVFFFIYIISEPNPSKRKMKFSFGIFHSYFLNSILHQNSFILCTFHRFVSFETNHQNVQPSKRKAIYRNPLTFTIMKLKRIEYFRELVFILQFDKILRFFFFFFFFCYLFVCFFSIAHTHTHTRL
jgi:hypothetical protein